VNYLLNAEMRSREFDVLGRLVASVPMRGVRHAGEASSVFDLCKAIVADASQFGTRAAMTTITKAG
jgi:hypothetical protein